MAIQSVNRSRGFTMIELLIALALSGMVIAAVGALYISVLKDQTRRTEQLLVMQGVDDVLSYIRRDALRAGYSASGLLPASGAGAVIEVTPSSLGYRYYDGADHYVTQFVLESNQIKLCRKKVSSSAGLAACGSSHEYLTDQNTIQVNQFLVSALPSLSAAYITITLSASLKNGEHPYQQTVSFLQRN